MGLSNREDGLRYCSHNHAAAPFLSTRLRIIRRNRNKVAQKSTPIAALTPRVTPKQLNNGLIGLINLGNKCYMNASLQALVHI